MTCNANELDYTQIFGGRTSDEKTSVLTNSPLQIYTDNPMRPTLNTHSAAHNDLHTSHSPFKNGLHLTRRDRDLKSSASVNSGGANVKNSGRVSAKRSSVSNLKK